MWNYRSLHNFMLKIFFLESSLIELIRTCIRFSKSCNHWDLLPVAPGATDTWWQKKKPLLLQRQPRAEAGLLHALGAWCPGIQFITCHPEHSNQHHANHYIISMGLVLHLTGNTYLLPSVTKMLYISTVCAQTGKW